MSLKAIIKSQISKNFNLSQTEKSYSEVFRLGWLRADNHNGFKTDHSRFEIYSLKEVEAHLMNFVRFILDNVAHRNHLKTLDEINKDSNMLSV